MRNFKRLHEKEKFYRKKRKASIKKQEDETRFVREKAERKALLNTPQNK